MTIMAQNYLGTPLIKQKNKQVLIYVIMGCLLCLRGINDLFLYPAILLGVYVILFADPKVGFPFLFFVLPFANIFKFSPEQFSFFTVLFFLFVARRFLLKGMRLSVFISCMILGCYLFLLSGFEQAISIITILVGIIFVSYSFSSESNLREIILAYSFGLILASIVGLLQDYFPIVKNFVIDIVLRLDGTERINRFSGLQGNPNYFTVDIVMALSGIAILLFHERDNLLYGVLFVVLTAIGLLSLSKSFLISWLALIFFMLILIFKSHKKEAKRLIFVVFGVVVVIYLIAAEQINAYIIRFMGTMSSMSEFTTGRTDIWLNYISVIWNNLKILFFGNGVNGALLNGRSPHNTYLEMVYSLGIFGSILFIIVLKKCFNFKIKKHTGVQYLPLAILLIRFLAIGLFTSDYLWFYLIIAMKSLQLNIRPNQT